MIRNCLYCTHCRFDGGEPSYSERTPGSPMVFRCGKKKWDAEMADKGTLIHMLDKAKRCDEFDPETKTP